MKQFIVYFLAPLITLLLAAMKVPDWTGLAKVYPFISGLLDWFVVLGSGFIYYFSILSPHRKYESAQKKKWEAMEKLAKQLCTDYKEYELGVNVMLVKTKYFYWLEPSKKRLGKKKFTLRGKVFSSARELSGAGVSPEFILTINQGVCGSAFRNGQDTNKSFVKGVVLLPEVLTPEVIAENNLTEEQNKLTEGIVFVAACPLIIKRKVGDTHIKRAIGVLNVESRVFESVILFSDTGLQDKFYEKIADLGNIFNTLHVE